jgi:hypothetical protein
MMAKAISNGSLPEYEVVAAMGSIDGGKLVDDGK